ncbi:40S ribosomal protein S10 [Tupaia chinensis]|uniref:Small ribosomal subunit protein eS10 n=1 Tax=Tupaia chinensis TaxID=246437 RepID=L9KW32_TUPCH|nr:40S ribosomal protein S10 [Tupaia chinensis]
MAIILASGDLRYLSHTSEQIDPVLWMPVRKKLPCSEWVQWKLGKQTSSNNLKIKQKDLPVFVMEALSLDPSAVSMTRGFDPSPSPSPSPRTATALKPLSPMGHRIGELLLPCSCRDVDAQEELGCHYELLFKEGVMVAKKDVHMPKHPELTVKNVPSLHVNEGHAVSSFKATRRSSLPGDISPGTLPMPISSIQYLRDYLHLPPEMVPATLRQSHPETGRPQPKGLEGERPARLTRREADSDTYRGLCPPV